MGFCKRLSPSKTHFNGNFNGGINGPLWVTPFWFSALHILVQFTIAPGERFPFLVTASSLDCCFVSWLTLVVVETKISGYR